MSSETVDVEALMSQIREKVRNELKGRKPAELPRSMGRSSSSETPTSIYFNEELRYMNDHWSGWQEAEQPVSHRPVIGKIILGAKNFVISSVWKYVIGKYFVNERTFHHNLVRYLNENARYIDRRDTEVFEHLFNKINSDIKALNERMDRLFDLAASERIALSEELDELRQASQALSRPSPIPPRQATSQ